MEVVTHLLFNNFSIFQGRAHFSSGVHSFKDSELNLFMSPAKPEISTRPVLPLSTLATYTDVWDLGSFYCAFRKLDLTFTYFSSECLTTFLKTCGEIFGENWKMCYLFEMTHNVISLIRRQRTPHAAWGGRPDVSFIYI